MPLKSKTAQGAIAWGIVLVLGIPLLAGVIGLLLYATKSGLNAVIVVSVLLLFAVAAGTKGKLNL